MLSAFMAFIEPGDEVIIFEPFFDQYVQPINIIWVMSRVSYTEE
jgi:kynurenine aminotransferase